jgi:hypothetical protein
VEVADKKGWTALHWCAADGHADVAELLLERGADLEAAGANGWTPLHLAANNGRLDMARLLLDAGADARATGLDAKAPMHAAATAELRSLLSKAAASSDGFAQGLDVGPDAAPEPARRTADAAPGAPRTPGGGGASGGGAGGVGTAGGASDGAATPLMSPNDPAVVASAMLEALGLRTPTFLTRHMERNKP